MLFSIRTRPHGCVSSSITVPSSLPFCSRRATQEIREAGEQQTTGQANLDCVDVSVAAGDDNAVLDVQHALHGHEHGNARQLNLRAVVQVQERIERARTSRAHATKGPTFWLMATPLGSMMMTWRLSVPTMRQLMARSLGRFLFITSMHVTTVCARKPAKRSAGE